MAACVSKWHTLGTGTQLIARQHAATIDDAAEVLADAQLSDPLTPEDVFAFYNWMLNRVIGEPG